MVKKILKKLREKVGLPPGSLIFIGDTLSDEVKLEVFHYTSDKVTESKPRTLEELMKVRENGNISWINISGLHDAGVIERIGEHFNIHSLVLEDIVNTDHRPKIEIFDDMIFICLKMIGFNIEKSELELEQISLILREKYVITFQEKPGDVFEPIRERIRNDGSRLRKNGVDYLFYTLIDILVDYYYSALENIGEVIERLEETVIGDHDNKIVRVIQALRRELIILRKSTWPVREIIGALVRGESKLIGASTILYFRDVYDHTIQVIDTVENYRDLIGGILDVHLSNVSNRMNEVMKTLTIIATIFIPLTYIAGIYGMNFDNMPELHWPFGYISFWGINLLIFAILLIFFRRRKWL